MVKKIFLILKIIFFNIFCFLIPINKQKIVFCSNNSKGVGCNPKYILDEILAQNLDFELVYLCDFEFLQDVEKYNKVKFVDYKNIFKRMFHLANARIWIDSYQKINDFKQGLIKKRGQIYINCWHGSFGIKKYGFDRGIEKENKNYFHFFKKDVKNIDFMFSNCSWEEEKYKSALGFKGKIIRIGHSRDDIFFSEKSAIKEKIYNKLKLKKETKVALYAPTFRDDCNMESCKLNCDKLKNILEEKFGGKWEVILKLHNKNNFDGLKYPDMHELLAVIDVLITDYSSCAFDFLYTKKPCFIYANDIGKYEKQRGLYYSFDKTPFLVAKTEDELFENIAKFDLNKFGIKTDEFMRKFNILNDGKASFRAVEFIKKL